MLLGFILSAVVTILYIAAILTYLYMKVVVWVADQLQKIKQSEKYILNRKGIRPINRKCKQPIRKREEK